MLRFQTKYRLFAMPDSSSHHTESLIASFANLNSGWHFGEGEHFSVERLNTAIRLHKKILSRGLSHTDAFPGRDGEVRITVYDQKHYYEFTLEANSTWTFVQEVDGEEITRHEGISLDKIYRYVDPLKPCSASEYLTLGIVSAILKPNCTTTGVFPYLTLTR